MTNNKYNNIKIPDNIDLAIEFGAKKASVEKKKKRNKRAVAIASSLTLIMTLGIISQPVIAKSIPILNKVYESLGFNSSYLLESMYIGKSVEENSIKVTIENITASKNIIKVALKVESKNEEFIRDSFGVFLEGNLEGIKTTQSTGNSISTDENTKLIVINMASIEDMPKKGTLKIRASNEKYNFDESFDLDIDFTESFNKVVSKDVRIEENINDVNVYGLKSSAVGSVLEVSNDSVNRMLKTLYLKVDGKVYTPNGYLEDNNNSEGESYLTYDTLTYDEIINAKDISIIPHNGSELIEKVSDDEIYSEELDDEKKVDGNKVEREDR